MNPSKQITVGIDATNIRVGGGVTHLVEFLRAAHPEKHGVARIVIWGGTATLQLIEDRPWLFKKTPPALDQGLLQRTLWQHFHLSQSVREEECDLLFVPGGNHVGNYHPIVTMSRNLLPFEWRELRRFGWSWMTVKLLLLRFAQTRSYKRADGLIFLNQYASKRVMKVVKKAGGKTTIIPHGVNVRFSMAPREQLLINKYDSSNPFRILYVSTVDIFKHQWVVAAAVANLRNKGIPVTLDLVGSAYPPALKKMNKVLELVDPGSEYIQYRGAIPYSKLHELYGSANLGLFASSCENMPNILVELMASGLPIVCSRYGSMPEVLGDAGEYFDPEDVKDIERSIAKMIHSPELRKNKSKLAYERSKLYSWKECASKTIDFLSKVAQR
jgi:glycosyltransferase involved in cell wall biosynthesis